MKYKLRHGFMPILLVSAILLSFIPTVVSAANPNILLGDAIALLNEVGGIGSFYTEGMSPTIGSGDRPLSQEQRNENLDSAISKIEQALEIDPSLNNAHYFLGVAYILKSQPEKAVESLNMAVDEEPRHAMSLNLLWGLFLDAKQYDKAMEIANQYIQYFPDDIIEGYKMIAAVYFLQGRYDKSIEYGEKVADLDRNNIDGLLMLADSFFVTGQVEKADNIYRNIVKMDQRYTEIISERKKLFEQNLIKK